MTTPAVAEDTTTPSNGNEQLGGSGEGTSAELSGYAEESLTNLSPQQSAATSETAGSADGSSLPQSADSLAQSGDVFSSELSASGSAEGSFLAALQKGNVEASKYFGNNWILYQIFIFVLHFLGGLRIPLLANFTELDSRFPAAVDDTITDAKVIEKKPTSDPRWEIWTVSSPSMGRNITVDVRFPENRKASGPAVYLFEGVDGPNRSHWLTGNYAQPVFDNEDATLIAAGGARANMYQDWQNDDPVLGRNKWETFYVEELAPAVESEINFNGKRAAIGLSMGASGAVIMANQYPGHFDAVAGLSGCYSTMDHYGRYGIDSTIRTRGGNPENMWGKFGSEEWVKHDVVLNPEGLRGTKIYLFAANGAIPQDQADEYMEWGFDAQLVGIILETGSHECTKKLSESLTKAGIEHTVDVGTDGAHKWMAFGPQIRQAWDSIKPALY